MKIRKKKDKKEIAPIDSELFEYIQPAGGQVSTPLSASKNPR